MKLHIDGETKIYGLLGSQIGYTKSPALHNRAAQILGINAVYLPFQIEKNNFEAFLAAAIQMNFGGFNITQPHKELAAATFPTKRMRSVNILLRAGETWASDSTDGAGFSQGFARIGRELSSFEELVFIGSGGAVIAVLEHLTSCQKMLPGVTVCRRSAANDASLSSSYGGKISFLDLNAINLRSVLSGRGVETLLVQASSAPLQGDDLQDLVPALDGFAGVVCDMVYSKPSKIYFAALNANLAAIDGEPMLIEQARAAQKIWWGRCASFEEMLLALRGK